MGLKVDGRIEVDVVQSADALPSGRHGQPAGFPTSAEPHRYCLHRLGFRNFVTIAFAQSPGKLFLHKSNDLSFSLLPNLDCSPELPSRFLRAEA